MAYVRGHPILRYQGILEPPPGSNRLDGVVLAIGGFSAVGVFCLIVVLLSEAVLQVGKSGNRAAD